AIPRRSSRRTSTRCWTASCARAASRFPATAPPDLRLPSETAPRDTTPAVGEDARQRDRDETHLRCVEKLTAFRLAPLAQRPGNRVSSRSARSTTRTADRHLPRPLSEDARQRDRDETHVRCAERLTAFRLAPLAQRPGNRVSS